MIGLLIQLLICSIFLSLYLQIFKIGIGNIVMHDIYQKFGNNGLQEYQHFVFFVYFQ